MAGYDAETGKPLHGDARIVQSIRRLARTQRDLVMRRHLECRLHEFVDRPGDEVNRHLACAALTIAIHEGEKRAHLRQLKIVAPDALTEEDAIVLVADGQNVLVIDAISRETGKQLNFNELIS